MGREIERKWLIDKAPYGIENYPHAEIIQGYLCFDPTVRVRIDGDKYYLTYKGRGLIEREEYNLPLNKEAFDKLIGKCDGRIIEKTRYRIPYLSSAVCNKSDESLCDGGQLASLKKTAETSDGATDSTTSGNREKKYTIELDVFSGYYEGKIYAEVEFDSIEDAYEFDAPDWFGEDVTDKPGYSNSDLARQA